MMHLLVLDLSNLCYFGAAPLSKQKDASNENYYTNTLEYLRTHYRYFKPDQVVFACDHEGEYWRSKLYPNYKAQRLDNDFKRNVRSVIKRFKTENPSLCIEHFECEADDVIFALCQYTDFRITIVSSDGDFEQLISERVRVFNPSRFQFRPKPADIAFNLFIKCMRGDRSDNISGALPAVTLKRLKEAYQREEPVVYLEKYYRFSFDLKASYELNRILIDLQKLPINIKLALENKIKLHFLQQNKPSGHP